MPVWKYRSIEETPETWEQFGDDRIGGRFRAALSFARLSGPLDLPRGVYKFRSFEELVADREKYEQARVDRIRARNERKP